MAVSDNTIVTGNPLVYTPRKAFAPIFNSTAASVASSVVGYYWREGQHFYADVNYVPAIQSSAVVVYFAMPIIDGVQLTINSSVLSGQGSTNNWNATHLGYAEWFDQSGGWRLLQPTFLNSYNIRFNNNGGQLTGIDMVPPDGIKLNLRVPVYEWR